MSITLFVDPGVHACGAALFGPGSSGSAASLLAAGFPEGVGPARALNAAATFREGRRPSRSDFWRDTIEALRRWAPVHPDALFIELPEIYDGGPKSKKKRDADMNDLIAVAAIVGGVCLTFPGAKQYVALPREWKGTMPKEIMHARALGTSPAGPVMVNPYGGLLSPAELAVIPKLPKSKLHNVLDAICMGLVFSGRMRSGGSAFDGNPARIDFIEKPSRRI